MENSSVPYIKEHWFLKNDIDKLILYKISDIDNKYYFLPWNLSLFLILIDGKRTINQIIERYEYLIDYLHRDVITVYINQWIEYLNKEEVIIGFSNDLGITRKTDYINLFIPPDEYEVKSSRSNIPVYLTLVLTNRCSTNCLYCYADRSRRNIADELSLSQWKQVINEIHSLGIKKVDLTGGDPLFRNDSMEIIEYLISKDIYFCISTKSKISKNLALRIKNSGFSNEIHGNYRDIQLSVDSSHAKIADYLVNKKNYLNYVTESIINLNDIGISPTLKAVLTPYNHRNIIDFINYFQEYKIKMYKFVLYSRSYYNHNDNLFLSKKNKIELKRMKDSIDKEFPEVSTMFQDDLEPDSLGTIKMNEEEWNLRSRCVGGWTTMIIQPNGDTGLCEQLPQRESYNMGNVIEKSIIDVWNGNRINDFLFCGRNQFKNTVCYNCDIFDDCHYRIGYCYRDSFIHYDTVYEAPPNCPFQNKPAKRMI
jgi:radical SAM protein with 4Fe4S-binding SPASM domain